MPILRDKNKAERKPTEADRTEMARSGQLRDQASGQYGSAVVKKTRPNTSAGYSAGLAAWFSNCANPACASGWLHLWRKRSGPVFESGWNCSSACTAAQIEVAIRREMGGKRPDVGAHRHRIPIGLVMLEQGWITAEQLRHSLDAQRDAGSGKLGMWLMQREGIPEQLVTRALSLQWNCPVLTLDHHDPEKMAPFLPRLFVEAFGVLPLRVAGRQILYVGFEDRPDPVAAWAIERMSGLRVEVGLVRSSLFQAAHVRLLNAIFPRTELIETPGGAPMIQVLAAAVERAKPVESRLVRLHDCLWLRFWNRLQKGSAPEAPGVGDVICSLTVN